MSLRVIAYDRNEADQVTIEDALKDEERYKWIDLFSPEAWEIDLIASYFDLHPLVIEDLNHYQERPKVEGYSRYTFMIVDLPEHDENSISMHKLFIVLGRDFVISMTNDQGVVRFISNLVSTKAMGILEKGPDFIAYNMVDYAVDQFYPVLDSVEDQVSHIEDMVIESPDRRVLAEISDVRRDLLTMRKSMWPMREVIAKLDRGISPYITRETGIYLRDVYDHIVQIMDLIETYRDITDTSRDVYVSQVSNNLNEVMTQLTIIATIMLPLTFIVGVYGMNFKHMPELDWEYGYYTVWAFMILLTTLMITYFKRKGWI
mgnify:CR=1 FL=1